MSAANQRQQCQICEGKNSRQIGWNDTVVTSTNDFFAIVLCIVEEWNPLFSFSFYKETLRFQVSYILSLGAYGELVALWVWGKGESEDEGC